MVFIACIRNNNLICATPFLIFCTKVKKPYAVLIMGTVVGLIYFATGQFHYLVPITFIATSAIAEIIRKATGYNRFWGDAVGFSIFFLGTIASPLPLWLESEAFIQQIKDFGMPQSYVDTVTSLTSPSMLVVMIVATIVCGLVGALVAKDCSKSISRKQV